MMMMKIKSVGRSDLAVVVCAIAAVATIGGILGSVLPSNSNDPMSPWVRQVLWCCGAICLSWATSRLSFQWWLRTSGAAFIVWLALVFAAHAQPMVVESHRYLKICGDVLIDTYTHSVVVAVLAIAALRRRCKMSSVSLLFLVSVALCLTVSMEVFRNTNRRARFEAAVLGKGQADSCLAVTPQQEMRNRNYLVLKDMMSKSKWFGKGSVDVEKVPYRNEGGITVSAALTFGRIAPIIWLLLNGLIACVLIRCLLRMKDPSARLFIAGFGGWLVLPAFIQWGECLLLLPSLNTLIPFININGLTTLVAGWGGGIVISAVRDELALAVHSDGKK